MQVSLAAAAGLERRLEVAVPAAQIDGAVDSRLREIGRSARLKGFRPGKAPFAVVRTQYGAQVRDEIVGDILQSSFADAINQQKLRPAADPRIEQLSRDPGADLKYVAVFEVLPEIALQPIEALKVDRPEVVISDADVEAMLENMRKQRPVFAEVARAAADTDRVTIDFAGTLDGVAFEGGKGEDMAFVLGGGRMLQDFESAVRGMSSGESRVAPVLFPGDYGSKDLAGKTASFSITLKKVEAQSLPPLDDAMAEGFGITEGGLDKLRSDVRASMEREASEGVRNKVRAQLFDALFAANPVELPRAMLEEQVQSLQLDMARRMGVKEASQLPPREQFEAPARRRVALGLLVGEIIRNESIKVDRSRISSRLLELTSAYPNPEEMRRQYLQNADAMRQVESAVLEDQVIDWLLTRATVTVKPITFGELTGFGQAAVSNT